MLVIFIYFTQKLVGGERTLNFKFDGRLSASLLLLHTDLFAYFAATKKGIYILKRSSYYVAIQVSSEERARERGKNIIII